ncbi:MAG: hypothetical protein AAGI67_05335 [Pseudomonadota bacterium]
MLSTVRLYEQEQQAQEAASQLKQAGFRDDTIMVLTPGEESAAAVVSAINKNQMAARFRKVCIQALQNGKTVLAVWPSFGMGLTAEEIMDSFGPVDTDSLPPYVPYDPSPLSDLLGIPTLVKHEHSINIRQLTRPGWTLSSMFGIGLLKRSDKSIIPMKELNAPKPNRRSSFGIPLLKSSDSAIIPMKQLTSSKSKRTSFGLPLLSKNGTPLSSLFNIPTLTKRQ